MLSKPKLIVILGPTASGKTDLAIKLAERFNGEVVSADSRQVYRGMNLGTGKVTKREMRGVPHYLLDVASPKRRFSVAQYQKLALKAIEKIQQKGKVPFLAGGTGFYIQAVVDGIVIPKVKPDWELRCQLEKKSAKELWQKLKKIDHERAKTIDKNNKRRLARALEIVIKTKKPVPELKKQLFPYPVLMIGIKTDWKILAKRIRNRLLLRIKLGLIKEVKDLRNSGISWKKLKSFGLEYRRVSLYLQKKTSLNEMIERLSKEIEHYAKRQMTWFKKDPKIVWLPNRNPDKKAKRLIKSFVSQS